MMLNLCPGPKAVQKSSGACLDKEVNWFCILLGKIISRPSKLEANKMLNENLNKIISISWKQN